MGRVENRLQEVEQAGNVQPHRLQFLRAELEDIRHELQLLENHVRFNQRQDNANDGGFATSVLCLTSTVILQLIKIAKALSISTGICNVLKQFLLVF